MQSEGGSLGYPKMSFLYELGISEFMQSIADLLYDSNSSQPRKGVVSGNMDDLQWAAPFEKMVEVIKLVRERGPAYGYSLDMDKPIYLMAPIGRDILQDELFDRVNLLKSLGVPTQNIKAHPQCQSFLSPMVLTKRRIEWGCKILGAFVGADEYVLPQSAYE